MCKLFPKAGIVVLVSAVCITAQERPNAAQRFNAEQRVLVQAQALKPAYLGLSPTSIGWAVRVIRTGGVDGRTLDVTITSEGRVSCPVMPGSCARNLNGEPLQAMNLSVRLPTIRDGVSSVSPLCRDCYTTRVTVKRREAAGIKTYFAYWDDGTAAQAPAEFVRIAQAALALHR